MGIFDSVPISVLDGKIQKKLGIAGYSSYDYLYAYDFGQTLGCETLQNLSIYYYSKRYNGGTELHHERDLIDEFGRFVAFPGIIPHPATASQFPLTEYVGTAFFIGEFVGDYAQVEWHIPSDGQPHVQHPVYYTLIDWRGEFARPFTPEKIQQEDQAMGIYHCLSTREGRQYKSYANKNMPFYVAGKEYSSINSLKNNPFVIHQSEGFPCFDSDDFANESRSYHRYIICDDGAHLSAVQKMLKEEKITISMLDPHSYTLRAERVPPQVFDLRVISTSDGDDSFDLFQPEDVWTEKFPVMTHPFAPCPQIDFQMEGTTLVKYRGHQREVAIPSTVTVIGDSAFAGCEEITSIEIPAGVTAIGACAFLECKQLRAIDLPENLVHLGIRAFEKCHSLQELYIPDGITILPRSLCHFCESLTRITYTNQLTRIESFALAGCHALQSIQIPATVTHIEAYALHDCSSLTEVVLPDGITEFEENVFSNCNSLTHINWPNQLTTIPKDTFLGCKALQGIHLPDTVSVIEEMAFQWCKNMVSIALPSSLISIGEKAFYQCSKLNSIDIPDGVEEIGRDAFFGCPRLEYISTPSRWKDEYSSLFDFKYRT